MSELHKIAVIGLPQSGKSSLTRALQNLVAQRHASKAANAHDIEFVEVHNPDELHGHTYDVVLQVVDSTRLEESLMLTPHIIDEHEKIVLAIGRYDLLLKISRPNLTTGWRTKSFALISNVVWAAVWNGIAIGCRAAMTSG